MLQVVWHNRIFENSERTTRINDQAEQALFDNIALSYNLLLTRQDLVQYSP